MSNKSEGSIIYVPTGLVKESIRHYITESVEVENEGVPDNLEEFAGKVDVIKRQSEEHGELAYLEAGLRSILSSGHIPKSLLEGLSGSFYAFDEAEMLELLEFVYSRIWCAGEKPSFQGVPNVQMVPMPVEKLREWRKNGHPPLGPLL